ncbi:MAG TPA: M20 family metallopeptidase [Pseudonocardiaceae bacterium]|jgi:hippurate hydrolase|nr:M20 family metallopeptidase [Pseudonocardiaceae bacterium]
MSSDLRTDAQAMGEQLRALRRELHRIPEIGLDLPRTQETVLAALDGLPLEVSTGESLSSITAVLRGNRPDGPVVLLRGDMDALPIVEQTGLPYASQHEGAMHACGHDLHTAGLVGAARLLSARRDELPGDIVFMFQPGEEGAHGAEKMIEEGILTAAGRKADAAYGLHVLSYRLPSGRFGCRPGPLMSASDGLFVDVVGRGGHGAKPYLTRDPMPAACEMVLALQTMVTRRFNIFDPVLITVGLIRGGTKRNIIPDSVRFEATIRSYSPESRTLVRRLCEEVLAGVATAHGVRVEIEHEAEYPVTVNDATEAQFVADTVREVFGEENYRHEVTPESPSEDFSFVLDNIPGAFVFLGASDAQDPDTAPSNHSPLATFDDSVVPDGAALLAELAIRRLAR